ncbi:hypothetical protein [Terrimonas pollutisoli]|uniref:hypothetical protein n=1 Tax=Terrimonas pollutisoli TaxID=3034147 RepID=UPI0023EB6CDA|nr:hypothetical protein [Terrimonas sp. H1YJ31]
MKNIFTTFRAPALISFFLVLPFITLELINRREFNEDFPFPLFILLWLLPVLFIFTLLPVVRKISLGNKPRLTLSLFARIVILTLLAWFWVSVILDQMPCFLGDRYCD